MDRQLIEYLPLFIQNYNEIKRIMGAEQLDIESAWVSAENVMNDQFVAGATENGVKRWETILHITPKATYTLEERKFSILTRLNEQLPYTIDTLKTSLTSLCGENGYALDLDSDHYELLVKLALTNKNNFESVTNLLNKIIPANIVTNVELMYNKHELLSRFTHSQLAARTHEEMRSEVI